MLHQGQLTLTTRPVELSCSPALSGAVTHGICVCFPIPGVCVPTWWTDMAAAGNIGTPARHMAEPQLACSWVAYRTHRPWKRRQNSSQSPTYAWQRESKQHSPVQTERKWENKFSSTHPSLNLHFMFIKSHNLVWSDWFKSNCIIVIIAWGLEVFAAFSLLSFSLSVLTWTCTAYLNKPEFSPCEDVAHWGKRCDSQQGEHAQT